MSVKGQRQNLEKEHMTCLNDLKHLLSSRFLPRTLTTFWTLHFSCWSFFKDFLQKYKHTHCQLHQKAVA